MPMYMHYKLANRNTQGVAIAWYTVCFRHAVHHAMKGEDVEIYIDTNKEDDCEYCKLESR